MERFIKLKLFLLGNMANCHRLSNASSQINPESTRKTSKARIRRIIFLKKARVKFLRSLKGASDGVGVKAGTRLERGQASGVASGWRGQSEEVH